MPRKIFPQKCFKLVALFRQPSRFVDNHLSLSSLGTPTTFKPDAIINPVVIIYVIVFNFRLEVAYFDVYHVNQGHQKLNLHVVVVGI